MKETEVRTWKKVFENDLDNIVHEFEEMVDEPAVIILSGELGAGKTTLVKSFLPTKGDSLGSPTYSLIQEAGDIAHADFYRIESAEEILHLELPLYAENKSYFFIEWGMKFLEHLFYELGADWSYYQMKIEVNKNTGKDGQVDSRNFYLTSLQNL